jgi:hypothetical protein
MKDIEILKDDLNINNVEATLLYSLLYLNERPDMIFEEAAREFEKMGLISVYAIIDKKLYINNTPELYIYAGVPNLNE